MDMMYYGKKIIKKIFNRSASATKKHSDPAMQNLIQIPLENSPSLLSSPVVLCGSVTSGKPTFNTLTNFGIVSIRGSGPVIIISTDSKNYTNIGIREHNTFSIGIPGESMVEKVNYCGTISGHLKDKSTVFEVQYGSSQYAPLVMESLFAFSCKVIQHTTEGCMDVFFGEIVEKYSHASIAADSAQNFLKPLCYGPGTRYRVVDTKVGTPWSEYRRYN